MFFQRKLKPDTEAFGDRFTLKVRSASVESRQTAVNGFFVFMFRRRGREGPGRQKGSVRSSSAPASQLLWGLLFMCVLLFVVVVLVADV